MSVYSVTGIGVPPAALVSLMILASASASARKRNEPSMVGFASEQTLAARGISGHHHL